MRSARPPKGWRRRTLRLGSYRLIFQVDRFGRCTPDECGYNHSYCPSGCFETDPDDLYDSTYEREDEFALFLEDLDLHG
ncbi:MAG TPA: hypothetical protein VNH41_10185 [Steroidobacteraceae bacterium]|nr:hypothetical protein [Steroidobacteraceae bacterium]